MSAQQRRRRDDSEGGKKEKTQGHIKRPMNSFMIWARKRRKEIAKLHPERNSVISKQLGKEWNAMSNDQKKPFIDMANELRRKHMEDHPGYKYKPKRKAKSNPGNDPSSSCMGFGSTQGRNMAAMSLTSAPRFSNTGQEGYSPQELPPNIRWPSAWIGQTSEPSSSLQPSQAARSFAGHHSVGSIGYLPSNNWPGPPLIHGGVSNNFNMMQGCVASPRANATLDFPRKPSPPQPGIMSSPSTMLPQRMMSWAMMPQPQGISRGQSTSSLWRQGQSLENTGNTQPLPLHGNPPISKQNPTNSDAREFYMNISQSDEQSRTMSYPPLENGSNQVLSHNLTGRDRMRHELMPSVSHPAIPRSIT